MMNLAKIEPISIPAIRAEGMDAIVEWFSQHKQSFYLLGRTYRLNQQQIEELFYRAILKVYKELPRFKSETSFELWVTSIFIHICRELSKDKNVQVSEESLPVPDELKHLDRLKATEREVMVLNFLKGFSKEETAQLLQLPVEKVKELLFAGIQSLRTEMGHGASFHGCKEYHKDYIEYLERTMDRARKIDLEIHIYHCPDCQEDLATFQDVLLTMQNLTERMEEFQVPVGFMENITDRLAEKEKHRQQKRNKRKKIGLIGVGVFAFILGIGFFTGVFTNLYYAWTEDDQQLVAFLQHDLGERLNLEAESDGVKINIKSVIADDVQTLVFYEIEDTTEDNQYSMDYHDGILVENEYEIMDLANYPRYSPPDLESDVNKEKKNVYHGKISLRPLVTENGTIHLKITKLQKLIRDATNVGAYGMENKTGEWSFEIPVTKQTSTEYVLDEETEVEGIAVRFDKLKIAPTATILEYGISHQRSDKRMDYLNFNHLEVNNKKVNVDQYGSSYMDSQRDRNWTAFQAHFDPLFGEKPEEFNVQFESAHLSFDDPKTVELEASQEYPHTFEYAGSTISIDKVEVGQPTKVVLSNHEIEDRAFESFQFDIRGEDEHEIYSMDMNAEGVLVDKNGREYDMSRVNPISYEELEQPRYFYTVQTIGLHSNGGENVIPKRLEIYGYSTTKYLDEVVKLSVE
ncbi:RNA polymerase sigma factor, sigma-70 family [Mesobacillus persicus]|uniref:RNA polymerase sigma factor, sigma-70 family n=1 Tax=Mesobacillus persicus TaxID=930146 RepID=A0A1H7Z0Y0_9BACI|nr:DUF4179 domain-containing protein [Mesobacillus persicus]SEM51187.1 RNA polymerase sigma factor, sigma-70 family [Mesobacillus persicus]